MATSELLIRIGLTGMLVGLFGTLLVYIWAIK
jgi:hypothetical protein